MSINPYILNMLEAYQPEQLHTLLEWLDPAIQNLIDTESHNPKAEPTMSTVIHLPTSNPAPLEDQVTVSIVNEFGPSFSGKAYFQWLRNCVSQRISA